MSDRIPRTTQKIILDYLTFPDLQQLDGPSVLGYIHKRYPALQRRSFAQIRAIRCPWCHRSDEHMVNNHQCLQCTTMYTCVVCDTFDTVSLVFDNHQGVPGRYGQHKCERCVGKRRRKK